jgi:hypothetical protein
MELLYCSIGNFVVNYGGAVAIYMELAVQVLGRHLACK